MKRSLYRFFGCLFLLVTVFLVGCQCTPKIVTVTKYETIVLTPPPVYSQTTPVPAIYLEADFMTASWAKRSQLNAEQTSKVYKSLAQCNADKREIATWTQREKLRYSDAVK